jgi:hypothetical protein
VLREHLTQDYLFSKILGADHQRLLSPWAAGREGQGGKQEAENSREKKP